MKWTGQQVAIPSFTGLIPNEALEKKAIFKRHRRNPFFYRSDS